MKKFKSIEEALKDFEESSIIHGNPNQPSRVVNRHYHRKHQAALFLRDSNAIDCLHQFLDHEDLNVRVSAASRLLEYYEDDAVRTLEEVSTMGGLISLTAEMVLKEWRKGSLNIFHD